MTVSLEHFINKYNSFEEFEKDWSDELLNEDARIGDYLNSLLNKYDKRAAAVSKDAGLAFAYVGNIINGKKNNLCRPCSLVCPKEKRCYHLVRPDEAAGSADRE